MQPLDHYCFGPRTRPFGFSGDGVEFEKALARADESIYDSRYRAQAEAFIDAVERRAKVHGVRFRGADALSSRESIVDGVAWSL